ncbi:hypothetical protein PGUG_00827 [Meyerozyma guilliermondii ATCC 6260]|uniref:Ribosomal protein L10 n=1 Tax=Meyerozyma guilliermondii (strain ATCC 6260 / CBS 566 / DSM 6381 / JCM 1539 / NBRC 10279 / NRRL Y-324) TaxID=294746 RepID=A5DC22_PICGU|nr:uncharacterized protein PGUG_00827 [Meyerozyma guilliermondii ATCC 6260]EDK36729.2 hypothetical protein PGUG_00827 [Meyerozyma guilliermondii ATCC 6260]
MLPFNLFVFSTSRTFSPACAHQSKISRFHPFTSPTVHAMFALRSLNRFSGAIRSSSVLLHAAKSISSGSSLQNLRFNTTSTNSPVFSVENRDTGKHIWARKTFLVDYYKYLNDNNEIVLYVHHNNLVRADNKRFRSELKKAGAQLTIIRNSIYSVYLRSEHEEDPADRETSKKNKDVVHPLTPLLNGPTGIITISQCDPSVVSQTLKILKSAQEKLILIGAKIESKVFDIDQVNQFKDLPNKDQLQGQLAGLLTILGGAGLVRTLESPGTALYLTLDQRKQDMDPESNDSL